MTFQEEVAEITARIGAAHAERAAAQASGRHRPYLDACRRLQSLERTLEGLRQRGLRAFG